MWAAPVGPESCPCQLEGARGMGFCGAQGTQVTPDVGNLHVRDWEESGPWVRWPHRWPRAKNLRRKSPIGCRSLRPRCRSCLPSPGRGRGTPGEEVPVAKRVRLGMSPSRLFGRRALRHLISRRNLEIESVYISSACNYISQLRWYYNVQ